MQGFFKDYQIKKYSFNQKILYIFDQLITELKPIIVEKYKRKWYCNKTNKFKSYTDIKCNVQRKKEKIYFLKSPFGIISISEVNIIIKGDNFYYKFQPQNLLSIQKQFKKIK